MTNFNFKDELNESQLEIVLNGDGHCLVLAGAGSGKTKTLVYRVIYLLKQGIDPSEILLLTFTNKAAKEMLKRIEMETEGKIKGLRGGTFHHTGNSMLRRYGSLINIKQNFNILDDNDATDMLKSIYREGVPSDKLFPKASVVKNIISLSSNLSTSISDIIKNKYDFIKDEYIPIIENIKGMYFKKKLLCNSLDFDDLLLKWNELLYNNDYKRLMMKKIKYLLIDEYQDTNQIQSELIYNLKNENILAVGDDSQSIYAFRGADINNILEFPKKFQNCKIFKLETNYRSTPEILTLANNSILNNEGKFEKNLKSVMQNSSKPIVAPLTDSREEATFICERILALHNEEGIPLNEISVLFRSHYQSINIELELNNRDIPYEMRGGIKFFEQAHIKDVLAFLKVISNYKDEIAWTRIMLMFPGIGPASAGKIWNKISIFDSISDFCEMNFSGFIGKSLNSITEIRNIFKKLSEINPNRISKAINIVVNNFYNDYAKASFENANERIEDITQLMDFSNKYESLEKFLSDAVLSEGFKGQRTSAESSKDEDKIVLSTIHQAKGLEWKTVFIIGLNEMYFPHAKSCLKNKDLEEERRLFYVASTRAKEYLYLSYALFSNDDNINKPSRFITELPKECYCTFDDDAENENTIYIDDEGEIMEKKQYLDFKV